MATPNEIEIKLVETHQDVPIVELTYKEPTLLTAEVQKGHAQALLELPYPRFALIMSYHNLSISSSYTSEEQAAFFQSPTFKQLKERLVTFVRYHPGSLTSMIFTMSVYSSSAGDSSNFVPDLRSAVRLARRGIDRSLVAQG
jgi:hypothetical protein